MTVRYYVCDIVGSGDADADDAFRPAVFDHMPGGRRIKATAVDGRTHSQAQAHEKAGHNMVVRIDDPQGAMAGVQLPASVQEIDADEYEATRAAYLGRV